MGFVKIVIGLPLAFALLVFAFVNNDMATFSLWPTAIEITVSLSVAIVFLVLVGYFTGWLFAWLSYAPIRRALKNQKKENKKLTKEQEKLTQEVKGLQDNIDNLKAVNPTEEPKKTWRQKLRSAFGTTKDSNS